jgi:hypothetical protein
MELTKGWTKTKLGHSYFITKLYFCCVADYSEYGDGKPFYWYITNNGSFTTLFSGWCTTLEKAQKSVEKVLKVGL